MPTTNQLILGAQQRLPKKRMRDKKTPALQGSPQKRGVCLRVYTKTPKKPNSAIRKIAKIRLSNNREIDSASNKTSLTVNKVTIKIFNNTDKIIEAKNCSTGEQKSILLSIFLSVAKMVKNKNNGRAPIILIDEAMAHLDIDRKEFLFSELSDLKSQVWFSGVSKNLFENISDQTVFFEMKNII